MPEARRTPPTTAERLGRMLVIVPYLVQHPGTTLDEASELFAVSVDQLRQDLDLLFLSGLPPYGPGDLIDVDIDEEGEVWISMADHFSRPLRLTRQEALAVHVRATELLATPGLPDAPALASALAKLTETLGGASAIVAATDGTAAPEHLPAIRAASDAHERVRIGYVAASTGERTERDIEPEAVFASAGHWYVAAWDVDTDGERLFRVDRIDTVTATGIRFAPHGLEGAGRPLYTPGAGDVHVRLRLPPDARWVAEYYATTDPQEQPDGSLEVTLPSGQLAWALRLLLRLGPRTEVLSPPEVGEQLRALAVETLAVYGR
jgi:proteasome accessory factor C